MCQAYWMPDYLPEWMLVNKFSHKYGGGQIANIVVYASFTGVWRQWNKNSSLSSEAGYHFGRLHGKEKLFYDNGKLLSISNYEYGIKEGLSTTFDENGIKIMDVNYHNGTMNGNANDWSKSGKKVGVVTYIEGKPDGITETWFDNGNRKFKSIYSKGKLISKEEWNEDGSIKIKWYKIKKNNSEKPKKLYDKFYDVNIE